MKGPPCSTPEKSHTKGHLGECPPWQTLLTKEQPDLPAAEFSIQQGDRLPLAPGGTRQGGSLGRPGTRAHHSKATTLPHPKDCPKLADQQQCAPIHHMVILVINQQ